MRAVRSIAVVAAFLIHIVGCGGSESPACAPVGAVANCTCSDGANGTQTCGAGGVLSACECRADAGAMQTDAVSAMDAPFDTRPADVTDSGNATDATDAMEASTPLPDVVVSDASDVAVAPGGVGAPCARNGDCTSGLCLSNGRCTETCTAPSDCVPGWQCGPLPGVGNLCQCTIGTERCDGLDNDCDGLVDNGTLCPTNEQCVSGACTCPPVFRCGSQCIADYSNDPQNCGRCAAACPSGAACVGGTCRCPSGEQACGSVCADLQSDASNCGACGNTCGTGGTCVNGSCTCPGVVGTDCSGACVDLAGDSANCGSCGHACAIGATCTMGTCACPTNQAVCDGRCIDVSADPSNCGSCYHNCAVGGRCTNGACVCPGTTPMACFGACADLSNDPMNCGTCSNHCAFNATCVSGACVCPAGQPTVCGMACVNLQTDAFDCGACGNACPSGGRCVSGSCQCPSGQMACSGVCRWVLTDPTNCGTCGNVCPSGVDCLSGSCNVQAPQLIAPLSSSYVTSQTPLLKWSLPFGVTDIHIDVCANRSCATVEQSFDVTGTSTTVPSALSRGVHYWRAHSAGGSLYTPTWEFIVGARSAAVNTVSGMMLDVNGDGLEDAAFGSTAQAAALYLGRSSGGYSATPATTLSTPTGYMGTTFGAHVSNAGDFNGDGFSDIVVSGMLYYGSATGLNTTPVFVGYDVTAGVGDINGDGYGDVCFTQSGLSTGLANGGPSGPTFRSSGVPAFADAAGPGDVNGDGYSDAVFGDGLRLWLFLGGPSGLTYSSQFTGPSGANMYETSGLGDLNGDGRADYGTGSASGGVAFVCFGTATPPTTCTAVSHPGAFTSIVGFGAAGDANGDGFDDFALGDAGSSNVYVYFGSAAGYGASPTTLAGTAGSYFGWTIVGGDQNGDHFADLVVTAPPARTANVYLGSSSGSFASSTVLSSAATNFGYAAAARQ